MDTHDIENGGCLVGENRRYKKKSILHRLSPGEEEIRGDSERENSLLDVEASHQCPTKFCEG